jgi:hypothetical protein
MPGVQRVGNIMAFPALILQREPNPAAIGRLIGLARGMSPFTYAFGPAVLGLVRDASGRLRRAAMPAHRRQVHHCRQRRGPTARASSWDLQSAQRACTAALQIRRRRLTSAA